MDKLVVFKQGFNFYVTPYENYARCVMDVNRMTRMVDFESAEEVILYWCKWYPDFSPASFIVM